MVLLVAVEERRAERGIELESACISKVRIVLDYLVSKSPSKGSVPLENDRRTRPRPGDKRHCKN
jgi:hypothetical protein